MKLDLIRARAGRNNAKSGTGTPPNRRRACDATYHFIDILIDAHFGCEVEYRLVDVRNQNVVDYYRAATTALGRSTAFTAGTAWTSPRTAVAADTSRSTTTSRCRNDERGVDDA
ncbi:hypothetical protein [Asanoa hainanensis]|uniref:hypothetical protein n=1 Tax=Asanoa hainanensis TaxID=560556 RepID=UPI00117CE254|nr:hypothetical protein [Asanoa hainanensis]